MVQRTKYESRQTPHTPRFDAFPKFSSSVRYPT